MSKSILIIDTPDNCLKCEFSDRRLDGTLRCTRNKDFSNIVFGLKRSNLCPLKDIPKKKEPRKINDSNLSHYHVSAFDKGYNKCIDDVLQNG